MNTLLIIIAILQFTINENKRVDFCRIEGDEEFKITNVNSINAVTDTVEFVVLASTGEKIYGDKFEARALLDLGYDESEEELEYIKQRLLNFLNDDNFHQLNELNDYDTDYGDRTRWECVTKESATSLYFEYKIYEEQWRRIGYCEKTGRVEIFWECC